MIVTDTNLAYDTTNHFYYLTVVGAEEYTGHDVSTEWSNDGNIPLKRLKNQGRMLKRWLCDSTYNVKPARYRHIDIIEYKIFNDTMGEREAVIDMLSEMVNWACHHLGS